MSEQDSDRLATAVATAQVVVDRLIALGLGAESNEWLAKYLAIHTALAEGRFADAIVAHSRLTYYDFQPVWVASRDLEKRVQEAMWNVAYEVGLPNAGSRELRLNELPTAIDERGTIADEEKRENERDLQELRNSFRDPMESDPRFTDSVAAADRQAESELGFHPLKNGFENASVFWARKKAILKQVYGLDWRTPREMGQNIYIT
jgi:hypothetical protein